jgi:hypothetical protein
MLGDRGKQMATSTTIRRPFKRAGLYPEMGLRLLRLELDEERRRSSSRCEAI